MLVFVYVCPKGSIEWDKMMSLESFPMVVHWVGHPLISKRYVLWKHVHQSSKLYLGWPSTTIGHMRVP